MAKLSAHGTEIIRYFSPTRYALLSVRSDGHTLARTPYSDGWKLHRRKKADVQLADWQARKLAHANSLPAWCRAVTGMPSLRQLEEWASEGTCETPTGDTVETDGEGPDGAPSWLRALGLI